MEEIKKFIARNPNSEGCASKACDQGVQYPHGLPVVEVAKHHKNLVDLTGQRFGRLVVVGFNGRRKREIEWLCRCDCGNEKVTTRCNLKRGDCDSCGCAAADAKIEAAERAKSLVISEMVGKHFGFLVIQELDGYRHGKPTWRCTCECGAERTVAHSNLKSGSTKSCGCYKKRFLHAGRVAGLSKRRAVKIADASKPLNPRHGKIPKQPRPQKAPKPPKEPRPSRKKFTEEELRERRRESIRRRMAERYADPLIRSHMLISQRMRKSLKRVGATLNGRTFKQLGFSDLELAKHLERQFLPGMSWENMGEWHIDHIIPISTAQTKEDVIRLNQLSNLRPLWKRDNLVKNAKIQFLI